MTAVLTRISSTSVALFALLFILALLVVPVPRAVVDVGLVLSLGCGLLLLSSTLRARHPLDLTTFPALVLTATLLRLGLNVATTRWILSSGDAGTVVRAFGEFAAAGDPLVGAAVYIVITILLVVVVSKGAERVAEVAARFSLDGLPGRQMAVDADMRAGVISFDQARQRRADLQREARLYGAMDGAMKFVRGDTMAGIAITVINLLIGVILGVVRDKLPAGEAFAHYGILTIGDGLCSQIPSLLTAVSSGLMVTRVPEEGPGVGALVESLRREVGRGQGRWLEVGGGLLLLGFLPGLPLLPFIVLSACCGGVALLVGPEHAEDGDAARLFEGAGLQLDSERETALKLAPPSEETAIVLEVGSALSFALLADNEGASLAAELQLAAVLLFERRGVHNWQTGVRFAARQLRPNELRILFYNHEILRSCVPMNIEWCFLSQIDESLKEQAVESWLHPISSAPIGGFHAGVLPAEVERIHLPRRVAMQVLGVAWSHAQRFMQVGVLQKQLNALDERDPGLVDTVVPERLSVPELCSSFRELIAEGMHIASLSLALDALACVPGTGRVTVEEAVMHLRVAFAGAFLSGLMRGGVLFVWVFSGELLQELDEELRQGPLSRARWEEAFHALRLSPHEQHVFTVPREGRLMVRELVAMAGIRAVVVAMEEVPRGMEMVVLGMVYVRPLAWLDAQSAPSNARGSQPVMLS